MNDFSFEVVKTDVAKLLEHVQWYIFFCDAAFVSHSLLNDNTMPDRFHREKLSRVKDMCEAMQVRFQNHPANHRNAKLRLQLSGFAEPVFLRADICEFCLRCLLDNAIKFCDCDGVRLAVKRVKRDDGEMIKFEVTDAARNLEDGHFLLSKFGEWHKVKQGGLQLRLWCVAKLSEMAGGRANFHWTKRSHGRRKLATWWFQVAMYPFKKNL